MKMILNVVGDCTLGNLANLVKEHTAIDDAQSKGTLVVHSFVEDENGNFDVEFRGTEAELRSLRRSYVADTYPSTEPTSEEHEEQLFIEAETEIPILPLVDIFNREIE